MSCKPASPAESRIKKDQGGNNHLFYSEGLIVEGTSALQIWETTNQMK